LAIVAVNLDIDVLRSFVAVAETRSFTAAAQAVSRTQSTISVQIKNLEQRIGFPLFERSHRSVTTTPRGERLLAYARDILRLNDEGVRSVTQSQVKGRIRLGITEYFAPDHVPSLLAQFREVFPAVDIQVTCGVTGMLRTMQRNGDLDVVIGRRDPGSQDGELIRTEAVEWVSGSGYRVDAESPLALALLPVGCGIRALALAALERQNRLWHVVYVGASVLGLQAAVASGLAVTCVTRSAVRENFRVLGEAEGLPPLPPSEIALFTSPKGGPEGLDELTEVVRDYFAQGVPEL
jgi:DNA-binding transcriptional LysR family regulator